MRGNEKRKPTEIDGIIGGNIKQCRLLRGVSLEELSDFLGVSHQQISKYESGENRVVVGRLLQIAELLDVPLNNFFAGIEMPHENNNSGFTPLTDAELSLIAEIRNCELPQRQFIRDFVCMIAAKKESPALQRRA